MNLEQLATIYKTSPKELMKLLVQREEDQARQLFTLLTSGVMGLHNLEWMEPFAHFKRMATFADSELILAEVQANEHLFEKSTREKIKVQQHTKSIILIRKEANPEINDPSNGNDIQDVRGHYDLGAFPTLMRLLEKFANNNGGVLQRTLIVKLAPQSEVYPHADWGWYYLPRDRFHLVLKSGGSMMTVQNETMVWKPGELWWFNNNVQHSAHNPSNEWRYHVIFDVLPLHNAELVEDTKKFIRYYRNLAAG